MSQLNDIRIKEVTITLDKERHLRYDLNAYAELEDVYGSVDAAVNKLQKGSVKAIRTVLWAGLIHEDESLTEKQVGAMLSMGDLEKLSKAVGEAMESSLPQPEDTEKVVVDPNVLQTAVK